jgi:hypothetical protein
MFTCAPGSQAWAVTTRREERGFAKKGGKGGKGGKKGADEDEVSGEVDFDAHLKVPFWCHFLWRVPPHGAVPHHTMNRITFAGFRGHVEENRNRKNGG